MLGGAPLELRLERRRDPQRQLGPRLNNAVDDLYHGRWSDTPGKILIEAPRVLTDTRPFLLPTVIPWGDTPM